MIALSLLLIALGGVARFAMDAHAGWAGNVNVHTVGLILMAVGGLGLLFSLIFAAVAAEPAPADYVTRRRRRAVVADPVDDPVDEEIVDDVPFRRRGRRYFR